MPASNEYTLIKLMRGNVDSSEAWIPEVGEPLLDMESGTLRFGDASNLGGIPINSVTTVPMKTPADLNDAKIWGRYYIDGNITNGPEGLTSGKFILVVQSSALKSAEIIQTLQLIDPSKPAMEFTRISINAGISWTPWKDPNAGFDSSNTDTSLNDYTTPGNYYVENFTYGPSGLSGCDAFLFVYRKNLSSPYVYQFILLTKCTSNDGKIYVRHSRDGGSTWESSIYDGWFELTDFCKKDFSNIASGAVLKKENGGTGRTDGTVWQADESKRAYYSLSYGTGTGTGSGSGSGMGTGTGAKSNCSSDPNEVSYITFSDDVFFMNSSCPTKETNVSDPYEGAFTSGNWGTLVLGGAGRKYALITYDPKDPKYTTASIISKPRPSHDVGFMVSTGGSFIGDSTTASSGGNKFLEFFLPVTEGGYMYYLPSEYGKTSAINRDCWTSNTGGFLHKKANMSCSGVTSGGVSILFDASNCCSIKNLSFEIRRKPI